MTQEELNHYGVLGMRWGVRRASYKSAKNERLRKKAADLDVKSAKMTKKALKSDSDGGLTGTFQKSEKSAKYDVKAAKLDRRAVKTTNEQKRISLEKKSADYKYKSAKEQLKTNRRIIDDVVSTKAMKQLMKSDKVALKAAKARKKIANNNSYIAMMDRKVSSLSKEELNTTYSFIRDYVKD